MATPLQLGVVLCVLLGVARSDENVTLTTKKGPIVGARFDPNPATQASYDAFIGIPYGTIQARFQLAVPRDSWSAPLVTQTDGPACPQPIIPFDEDCLYLNVFTPVKASESSMKLPVMVFIHGSGFTISSSSSKFYGPDFLIPEGIILVTMNYRLGAVGFLTLGSKLAPGNLGLHDTVLALQWVQEEISVFGGDPAQVTLFGQSAGSVMTHFHCLSTISSDLFSKAIAQSGAAPAEWAHLTLAEGTRRGKLLAQAVGCDVTQNDSVILACLQKADINSIVAHQSNITNYVSMDGLMRGNGFPFIPVLDTYLSSDKPFFNNTIENLMEQTVSRAKPMITGFTTDEGILIFYFENWWMTEGNLAAFVPPNVTNADKKAALLSTIKNKYFPATPDQNKVQDIVQLFTNVMFSYPSIKVSRYFANTTYGYLFAYDGSWALTPSYFSRYKLNAVNHGDDLLYLFYSSFFQSQYFDTCPGNTANLAMMRRMVKWWTTFAKTGAPGPSWKTISEGGYLTIDSKLSTVNSSYFESLYYNFWEDLQSTSGTSVTARLNVIVVLAALWTLATVPS